MGDTTDRAMLFFFSSRRRHTRCSRDWSSDVCSSDLAVAEQRCDVRDLLLDVAAIRSPQSGNGDVGVEDSHVAALPDERDRKSTRLNSSHGYISYAVFCLKKKKQDRQSVDHGLCPEGRRD